ncbi:hypothetical protein GOODEAATRI_016982 [Goodea atripinnis]|uniref:Uncharacterized protein n=1 Tax=Goodea atripinnis TaxID=208336 RepID=A0ABV0NB76_9TELE
MEATGTSICGASGINSFPSGSSPTIKFQTATPTPVLWSYSPANVGCIPAPTHLNEMNGLSPGERSAVGFSLLPKRLGGHQLTDICLFNKEKRRCIIMREDVTLRSTDWKRKTATEQTFDQPIVGNRSERRVFNLSCRQL